MSRLVTLRATFQELFGDETYEVWLKHETDAWILFSTGTVALSAGHQDFLLDEMIEGDDYVAQIRLVRDGRVRLAYQPSDPSVWPTSSRVAFTVGELSTVGSPVLDTPVWSRTDAAHAPITFNLTGDDPTKDVDIYRDDVLIQSLVGGTYGSPEVITDEAPLGASHSYIAKHRAGTLVGPASNELTVFAGPAPATALVQTSDPALFGSYTVTWDGAGSPCRYQDDFLCPLTYTTKVVTSGGTRTEGLETDVIPTGPVQTAAFRGRVRREVTSFGVVDVSDWIVANIACGIYESNTDYQSCP